MDLTGKKYTPLNGSMEVYKPHKMVWDASWKWRAGSLLLAQQEAAGECEGMSKWRHDMLQPLRKSRRTGFTMAPHSKGLYTHMYIIYIYIIYNYV